MSNTLPPLPTSDKDMENIRTLMRTLADGPLRAYFIKTYPHLQDEIESKHKDIRSGYKHLSEATAVVLLPQIYCPECRCQMETNMSPNGLKVIILHHNYPNCSRSETTIIRPLAAFTKFI